MLLLLACVACFRSTCEEVCQVPFEAFFIRKVEDDFGRMTRDTNGKRRNRVELFQ